MSHPEQLPTALDRKLEQGSDSWVLFSDVSPGPCKVPDTQQAYMREVNDGNATPGVKMPFPGLFALPFT